MAATVNCPKCGYANAPGTMFCSNCGASMAAGPTGPPSGPTAGFPGAYSMPPVYPSPYDADRNKQVDRTKTGLLLLLIGTLFSWVPFVGAIGGLIVLIGAILVILGRRAFGPAHARNVLASIALFFVGIIILFIGGFVLGFSLAAGLLGGTPTQAAIEAAFNNFLILLVVGSAVGGLGSVFFSYALQNQTGKMLLWAGYAASVVVQVVIFVVIRNTIAQFVAAMFPGGAYDPTAAAAAAASFQAAVSTWSLLSAIPSLLYAGAYYLAWNRVNKGELPAPVVPSMGPPPPVQPR